MLEVVPKKKTMGQGAVKALAGIKGFRFVHVHCLGFANTKGLLRGKIW